MSKKEAEKIRAQVKVRLVGEEPFWGPGTEQIMCGIQSKESVREACRESGISYSKARKMIARAETGWGVSLVERQQGGKNGGISRVTEEGKKRIALFEELERDVQAFAEKRYRELEALYFLESE